MHLPPGRSADIPVRHSAVLWNAQQQSDAGHHHRTVASLLPYKDVTAQEALDMLRRKIRH